MLTAFLFLLSLHEGLLEHRLISAADTRNEPTTLKVTYAPYERGSRRVTRIMPLRDSYQQATLSFEVKFCEGFDFARGGKLHGLGSERPITGSIDMDGINWSARLMWRDQGTLQSYVYHQAKDVTIGDAVRHPSFQFKPGVFYQVEMSVKLNSAANKQDGTVHISVNDELLIEHTELQFFSKPNKGSAIQNFLFNTFHGGSDESWAPRNESGELKQDCAYFRRFSVEPLI